MKNENQNQKTYKIVAILNFFAGICFYISAVLNLIDGDNSMGIVYLCLGSVFVCLGIVNSNNCKKDKNNK